MRKTITSLLMLIALLVAGLSIAPNIFAQIEEKNATIRVLVVDGEGEATINETFSGKQGNKLSISLDGLIEEGKEFAYFIHNGEMITDTNTKFLVSASTAVIIVIKEADTMVASFVDSNGSLIGVDYTTDGNVESPNVEGYKKPGYSVADLPWGEEVISIDRDRVYKLHYELEDAEKEVVISVDGVETTYEYNEVVILDEPGNEKHYEENGKVLSINNETYKFSALYDRTIVTVESESTSPIINLSPDLEFSVDKETYLGQYQLPENYTFIETGIIGSGTNVEELTLENAEEIIASTAIHPNTNEFLRSINKNELSILRAYLVVDNGTTTDVIYSDTQYTLQHDLIIGINDTTSNPEELNKVYFWSNKYGVHNSFNDKTWRIDKGVVWATSGQRTAGDYYSIVFYGTGIDLFARIDQYAGNAYLILDSNEPITINNNSAKTNHEMIYSVSGLNEGIHKIKVEMASSSGISFYQAKINFTEKTVKFDENSSNSNALNQVYYWSNKYNAHTQITINTQTWRKSSNSLDGAWANASERSTGDYYSITFYGTGIDIYSKVEKAYGIGIVSVDDGESVEVDFYSENAVNNKLVYSIHDLEQGLHTIKIALKDGSKTVSFYRAVIKTSSFYQWYRS